MYRVIVVYRFKYASVRFNWVVVSSVIRVLWVAPTGDWGTVVGVTVCLSTVGSFTVDFVMVGLGTVGSGTVDLETVGRSTVGLFQVRLVTVSSGAVGSVTVLVTVWWFASTVEVYVVGSGTVCPVQCVTVGGLCAVCFVAKCSTVVSIT